MQTENNVFFPILFSLRGGPKRLEVNFVPHLNDARGHRPPLPLPTSEGGGGGSYGTLIPHPYLNFMSTTCQALAKRNYLLSKYQNMNTLP